MWPLVYHPLCTASQVPHCLTEMQSLCLGHSVYCSQEAARLGDNWRSNYYHYMEVQLHQAKEPTLNNLCTLLLYSILLLSEKIHIILYSLIYFIKIQSPILLPASRPLSIGFVKHRDGLDLCCSQCTFFICAYRYSKVTKAPTCPSHNHE